MDTNIESGSAVSQIDRSPIPESNDKYASYYELNTENDNESGNSESQVPVKNSNTDASDEKQVVTESSTEDKKPKEHQPDYIRRINTLTKRNKQYESEMAALRREIEALKPKQAEPKLTRDNFLTDEEYLDHRAEQKAREVLLAREQEALKQRQEMMESQNRDNEFKQSWKQKSDALYANDPQGYEQLKGLLAESDDNMHQDIHDYIEDSPIGPRLLHVLLLRPDLVERYNNMKSVSRGVALSKLEDEILGYMNGSKQEIKQPQVSRAPTPIGQVGTSGNARTELSDEEAIAMYRKKKYGR